MKVRELIQQLQTVDPEAFVLVEGCDCWGTAHGVEVLEESQVRAWVQDDKEPLTGVLIKRED